MTQFVKLIYSNGSFDYKGSTSVAMDIIGFFLLSDVGISGVLSYKEWILHEPYLIAIGNITHLEKKEDDTIILTDLYSEEEVPTQLKMTKQQFIQLLDDWQEKVCKHKPKEVIIKHEKDQFAIETK